jgi:hypothetical protein
VSATTHVGTTPAPAQVSRSAGVDAWVWFAAVVGAIFWAGVARSLGDPDIWWHVRTGQLILDDGVPRTEPWAFTAIGRPWVPTAWLSDVLLAMIHDWIGWRGIIALTVALSAVLLITLARQLFHLASGRIAAPVYAVVVIVVSPFLAERPQLVSLVLVVWLAGVVRRLLVEQELAWWAIPVGYLWANLHGMWVLLPAVLVVATVGLALDRQPGWRPAAGRSLVVAAASFAGAALTLAGPRLAYWPFVVRDAASDVSEWRPTTITGIYGLAFVALLALWVLAVARSRTPAPVSEVLWVVGSFTFGMVAARNVAPAALLMAPFVVVALERAYGPALRRTSSPRLPIWLLGGTVALAVGLTTLRVATVAPIADGVPLSIVDELKSRPGTVRVLNSYSVGGVLTGLGAPEISVAIDGRTDNFSPEFVHRHFLATTQLFHWRQLMRDLDPDAVVVGEGGQLYDELIRIGWTLTLVDGDFALLDPPAGS